MYYMFLPATNKDVRRITRDFNFFSIAYFLLFNMIFG